MLMSKILPKVKWVAFILSFVLIAGIGLAYMLLSDYLLSNAAIWLLITTILSIGSAVCIILSANYKEKPTTMYILIGVAILCAVLFLVTIYAFAQMPIYNDQVIYNEDGTVKEKISGTKSYMTTFKNTITYGNGSTSIEDLPEMPKFLAVKQKIESINNKATEVTVCEKTMFYVDIVHTGNTSLETLRENKTYNTVRNFNIIVTLSKVFGYMAVAVQAVYLTLCVVVKEQ